MHSLVHIEYHIRFQVRISCPTRVEIKPGQAVDEIKEAYRVLLSATPASRTESTEGHLPSVIHLGKANTRTNVE